MPQQQCCVREHKSASEYRQLKFSHHAQRKHPVWPACYTFSERLNCLHRSVVTTYAGGSEADQNRPLLSYRWCGGIKHNVLSLKKNQCERGHIAIHRNNTQSKQF